MQPVSSSSEPTQPPPVPKEAAAEPKPVKVVKPPVPSATARLPHCRRCGSENEPDSLFCSRCGVSIKETSSPQSALDRALNPEQGRSWVVTMILCLLGFVAVAGVHRLYTGHIVIGIVQLLTVGMCGIWTLIDLILLAVNEYKDADGMELTR